jgi:hypothetical protein
MSSDSCSSAIFASRRYHCQKTSFVRWRPIQMYHLYLHFHAHIKCVLCIFWEGMVGLLIQGKVTYRYYIGMLNFLNENYAKARWLLGDRDGLTSVQSEQELTLAFYNCHIGAHANQQYVPTSFHPRVALSPTTKTHPDVPLATPHSAWPPSEPRAPRPLPRAGGGVYALHRCDPERRLVGIRDRSGALERAADRGGSVGRAREGEGGVSARVAEEGVRPAVCSSRRVLAHGTTTAG